MQTQPAEPVTIYLPRKVAQEWATLPQRYDLKALYQLLQDSEAELLQPTIEGTHQDDL